MTYRHRPPAPISEMDHRQFEEVIPFSFTVTLQGDLRPVIPGDVGAVLARHHVRIPRSDDLCAPQEGDNQRTDLLVREEDYDDETVLPQAGLSASPDPSLPSADVPGAAPPSPYLR